MGVSSLHPRGTRQTARLRNIVIASVLCLAIYCFLIVPEDRKNEKPKQSLSPDLFNNRFLTEDQCRASFPGLLSELDKEVSRGPFKLERNPYNMGPLIARIRDGQLYILSAARKTDLSKDMLAHRSATLHQIANALLTWPRPASSSSSPFSHIPNTIIAFNHQDEPIVSTFSYSRPADPAYQETADGQPARFFPIPHFSFYSWPVPFIGSFQHAARKIAEIEESLPFSSKIPRAVWRGTAWFNNARAGRLRQNLVGGFGAGSGKDWADVEALDWTTKGGGDPNATNALRIEDFCRYKYVIHTEGVTYSGRFQFHNLCASVVLSPPIAWSQHLTHLLRPVFSYALDPDANDDDDDVVPSRPARRWVREGSEDGQANPGLPRHPIDLGLENPPPLLPYPAPWVRKAWPKSHAAATEANMVFVAPDWSDLEAVVAWLEAHPRTAEGIATRQRALFADGGYFSPAAETCYWRALIRGWSDVVRVDDAAFEGLDEVPWEEFSLKEIHF